MLKQIAALVTVAALSFGAQTVMAQGTAPAAKPAAAAGGDCEKQADEKKLHGAARTSFVKKCSGGAAAGGDATKACEAKAVDKNGKPLAGAAKTSFMKKCVADAK